MAKRKKSSNIPANSSEVSVILSKEAQERLATALVTLSQTCGKPVAATTLLEVLFSPQQLDSALELLAPRFKQLAELERQRKELGIYFE